ncbi:hypothetical protein GCM10010207_76010 [Streptomyces atratus]|uniref:hypothetical protein n=1 Tax=Streptomyces atratus TaxID=1893 RepID=UPI0019A945A5|nr:hypothetical protein [Streptomyces atratus]GGT65727.1 hypothetical protein GCM10010207_76010 [Streptomyces atratus]
MEHTAEERRHIALDEDELAALNDGFERVERLDAEGLAVLALRGPAESFSAEEKLRPEPQAVFGAATVVTDASGRVLLSRDIHLRLRHHRSHCTSLLVSHRLSAVRDADRIVVLTDGRITEEGTHDALLLTGGTYAQLFALQASGYQQV